MIKFGKTSGAIDTDLSPYSPLKKEIPREALMEDEQEDLVKKQSRKTNQTRYPDY
jgi:hypothetical protein